jgi:hypothetical protein
VAWAASWLANRLANSEVMAKQAVMQMLRLIDPISCKKKKRKNR